MRNLVALVCVVILAGCASTGTDATEPQSKLVVSEIVLLTERQKQAVYLGVRSQLKDPVSAIFGEIIGGPVPDSEGFMHMVCGWVNAKNSYGGYTGPKPFFGTLMGFADVEQSDLRFALIRMGGTEYQTLSVLSTCGKSGL